MERKRRDGEGKVGCTETGRERVAGGDGGKPELPAGLVMSGCASDVGGECRGLGWWPWRLRHGQGGGQGGPGSGAGAEGPTQPRRPVMHLHLRTTKHMAVGRAVGCWGAEARIEQGSHMWREVVRRGRRGKPPMLRPLEIVLSARVWPAGGGQNELER